MRSAADLSATTLTRCHDVRITRLGADGDGVAALPDGTPLYIPYTLPGEELSARVLVKRGEGFAAIAERRLADSPDRAIPPCPHFGVCGGCSMQHLADPAYTAWKAALVVAALRRAGFDTPDPPLLRTAPRTRRRMDLALRRRGAVVTVGLHAARSDNLVDLQACEILDPTLFALVTDLRTTLRGLTCFRREGSAIVNLLDSGPDLLLRLDAAPDAGDRSRLAALAERHAAPRISCAVGPRDAPEIVAMRYRAQTAFSGVLVSPPPGAFMQASRAGEAAIVAAVLAGLPARLPARVPIVELYAGCGTLTFALAQRGRVLAFEGDAASAASLREAANNTGRAGRVEVATRDLVRQPLSVKDFERTPAIVLDPPHTGAPVQMQAIAASGVPCVIYVSCNPVALTRDAQMLATAGYRLASVVAIDQFLWSARVESVSVFTRDKPARG